MPGYELERFVDLSQIERAELICSICQDIFRSPIVTNCCLQTFCEECITGWLSANNTCPYDRKKLKASNLSRPPRLLMNMLGNLKICCAFKEKGCEEILLLENVESHETICHFNKKICDQCECEILSDHNCIQSLLNANKYLREDLNSALNKNQILSRRLQDSKFEIEKCLQTIENLTIDKPLNSETFSKSRKYLETPLVNYRSTSEDMKNKIVYIVKNVLRHEQNLSDVCKSVKELVEAELDGLWHCSAFYDNIGSHCFTFDDVFLVSLIFGKLKVTVHKVYDDIDIKKLAQLLRSGKLKEDLIIEKTDMNETCIILVKEIVLNSIKTSNNLSDLTKNISRELSKCLDGVWHSFAFRTFLANCYVCPKSGSFINLTVSDVNIVIFQV